jgi:hypothetical protein
LFAVLTSCGGGSGSGGAYAHPVRPEQAELIGSRVRVTGACALAGTGPSTGVWVLEADGFSVEVRGLVPRSCAKVGEAAEVLTIFAQVEPKGPDSDERLLLRLPD